MTEQDKNTNNANEVHNKIEYILHTTHLGS